jgi:phosphoserine phosphatase
MNGGVKFEDALEARLAIIKPSRNDIKDCLAKHPPALTPGTQSLQYAYSRNFYRHLIHHPERLGIKELIETLHKNSIEVFFVSGGFRLMIEPVAKQLNVPLRNIYANTIFFEDDGAYRSFDDTELTSRDGGKAAAIKVIKKTHGHDVIAMVGDGVTDLQARPPADLFVGFGGVVVRPIVKEHADWFVTDFHDLTSAFPSTH